MEEDVPILKQKKRKVAIDPDQEDDENVQAVVTKTTEESLEREKYEHKTNGDKKPEVKKQPEKKEEAKPKKEENKTAPAAKPKPTSEKEKSHTQKENEPKAKPNSVSSDKKPSDSNGQQAKKPEEKKAVAKPASQPVKRRKEESESEESDSESEDEKPKKKKTPVKKEPVKKEPVRSGGKDELIYNVLKRWWYCLPEWPPANFDYTAELLKRNLRKVDFKYFRIEKDIDDKGLKKVYEIPSYPGVFKNAQGENVDLRPRENCPCYEVLKKKGLDELLELLSKALKGQIEALENSGNNDEEIMKDLQRELKRAEKTIASRKK